LRQRGWHCQIHNAVHLLAVVAGSDAIRELKGLD
jgi:hypothetical protein